LGVRLQYYAKSRDSSEVMLAKPTLGELAGGMKQKEQQQVLQAYRDGEFNVLLATCIGQEGLDIPQVRTCLVSLGVKLEYYALGRRASTYHR
jgi:ERCC4-related helicase